MNEKCKNVLVVLLTAAFLLSFLVWSLVKPDEQRSLSERRALAQFHAPEGRLVLIAAGKAA